MDIEEIKRLIELMVANDLGELNIEDGDKKIALKRGAGGVPAVAATPMAAAPPAAPVAPAPAGEAPADEGPAEDLHEIRSPMVGTFYAASTPDSDPFVAVDDVVEDDTVVCIISAMKVMNEIRAEWSGTIVEVCVENAQPVEFGQVLFRVRTA